MRYQEHWAAVRLPRDPELFAQVKVVYGSLEWPGERDLAHDMLYAESVPVAEVVGS